MGVIAPLLPLITAAVSTVASVVTASKTAEAARKQTEVTLIAEGERVERLNEMEYDGRYIWANQWQTDFIYRILEKDPRQVFRYELPSDFCPDGNPNGIAFEHETGTFYITGQRCPKIWRVRFR